MGRESKLTKRLSDELEKIGGELVVISGNRRVAGYPDRALMHRVWRGLVEVKTLAYSLEPHQKKTIERLWKRCPWGVATWRLAETNAGVLIVRIEDPEGGLLCDAFAEDEWLYLRDALAAMRYGALQCRDLSTREGT